MNYLKIKKIEYNYFNFYNKLFLNKNLNIFLLKKNIKNVKFFIKQKPKLTKIVSLRAPKHFKVGRHHYQVLKQNFKICLFKQSKPFLFNNVFFFKIVNYILKYLDNKTITKPFSYNNTTKIKIELNSKFKVL